MTVPSEEIEKYLNISISGGGDFHPSKNEIAFISNKSGVYQIYTKNLDTGDLTMVSSGDNRATNPVYLPSGDLVYSTDFGGDERFQLMVYSGGSTYRLTTFLEAKHRFQFATDNAIYLSANILDNQRFDVFRYSFPLKEGMKEELIMEGEPFIPVSPSLVNEDESVLVISRIKSNLANDLILYDLETKEASNISQKFFGDHNARFAPVEFLSDSELLLRSDYQREFLSLARLDLTSGKLEYLEADSWDTGRTILLEKQDQPQVIFTKNIDGSDKLFRATLADNTLDGILEIELPHPRGILAAGDFRTFTRSFVANEEETLLLVSFSSPVTVTNVYKLDLGSGEIEQMVDLTQFDGKPFMDLSLSRFKSFDGLEVPYFIHAPEGDGPFPTIFVIHGGPEGQSRAGFSNQIQLLISQDYMVVIPNIRGSAGYGRTYLSLDDIEKRLDSIKDIHALVNHLLASDSRVDKNRLVVYGGSYGGFAVLSSITEYPQLFDAAIDIVGISNFVTFLKNTADWRRRLREVEYGYLDKHMDVLEQISPSRKVHLIETPTLIIQGDNDERVPLSESIQIYEKLQENGVPSKLVRFEDEGHGVVKRKNQIVEYQEIFQFLHEHL